MKRLPNSLLLSLVLIALPVSGAAAGVTTVCSAVQAAGLSLPERHVAAKLEAEAALSGASEGNCRGSAVQVMVEPGGHGAPLQLQDDAAPRSEDSATAHPAAATGDLPELPPEVMAHWAHVAPLATPAIFTGMLPLPARC